MKIFMIGGTGLLGAEGARILIEQGHEVKTLSLPPIPEGSNLPEKMEIKLGNYLTLSDDEIREQFRGPVMFQRQIERRFVFFLFQQSFSG